MSVFKPLLIICLLTLMAIYLHIKDMIKAGLPFYNPPIWIFARVIVMKVRKVLLSCGILSSPLWISGEILNVSLG